MLAVTALAVFALTWVRRREPYPASPRHATTKPAASRLALPPLRIWFAGDPWPRPRAIPIPVAALTHLEPRLHLALPWTHSTVAAAAARTRTRAWRTRTAGHELTHAHMRTSHTGSASRCRRSS